MDLSSKLCVLNISAVLDLNEIAKVRIRPLLQLQRDKFSVCSLNVVQVIKMCHALMSSYPKAISFMTLLAFPKTRWRKTTVIFVWRN